ncbi:MAG: 2-amino-4-hydroxy-6-hydroxymethyldihydropteridine diphosphokinase [Candidatus Omnitrophota bacterium]
MKRCWQKTYLGIGSNLGDRKSNIELALSLLCGEKDVRILGISSLYETEPVGGPDQGMFLNGAVCILTDLHPNKLLKVLKAIESDMGRKLNSLKWSPRIIDLDILFYGDLIYKCRDLKIPHPLMHKRKFVLMPMADLSPLKKHPILKKTIKKMLKEFKS